MPTRDSLLARALLDAQLKYDPQIAALRGLRHERAGEYTRTRRVNASNAAVTAAAIDQVSPDMGAAFDEALSSVNAQRAALGVGAEDPQAAAFTRRVGEEKGNALAGLLTQRQQATTGRVYANENARSEYLADKGKIDDQLLGLLGEAGSYAASRRGELADERAKRSLTARGLTETARHNQVQEGVAQQNADTSRRRAAASVGGRKLATTEQHATARDRISEAVAQVKRQQQLGATSRAEIIQLLSTGRAAQKVKVGGKDVALPAIPKLPADFVRAATNIVFDGSLSEGDVKRLHNRRLRVKSLGYGTRRSQAKHGAVSALQGLAQSNPRLTG